MSDWHLYYLGRLGYSYTHYSQSRYKPFLDMLVSSGAKTAREEGCGIGTMSILLSKATGVVPEMSDMDPRMVHMAGINAGIHGLRMKARQQDILDFTGDPVDLIFSHGVLEHFDADEIRQIIQRQTIQADRVIHYVPTDGYSYKSFGDERLFPIGWWAQFHPDKVSSFNDGKDLALQWGKEVS